MSAWERPVAVADHPAELVREPRRAFGRPDRGNGAADHRDPAVGERSDQVREPVVARDRVVVEERHDVALGDARAGVARSGQTRRLAVGDHVAVGQRGAQMGLERRVVVADDDGLQRGERLARHRRGGVEHLLGSLLRVAADHDRHRRQRRVLRGRPRGSAVRRGSAERSTQPSRHGCRGDAGSGRGRRRPGRPVSCRRAASSESASCRPRGDWPPGVRPRPRECTLSGIPQGTNRAGADSTDGRLDGRGPGLSAALPDAGARDSDGRDRPRRRASGTGRPADGRL